MDQAQETAKLPMEEALRRWSDPDLVRDLYRFGAPIRRIGPHVLDMDPGTPARLFFSQWTACRQDLEAKFVARLKSGKIVATGIRRPFSEHSRRETVAPHLWEVLKPDFKANEASVYGLYLAKLEFHLAGSEAGAKANSPTEEPPPPEFTHNSDYTRVTIRGQAFNLSGGQTQIVRELHRASQTECPWVRAKELLHIANLASRSLRDVFRRHTAPSWRDLIQGNGRGLCRLNLKGRTA